MSQENVENIRQGFEAFNRGDLDHVLDQMSEGVVTYRGEPFGDTFYGKAGFLDVATDWIEGFAAWSVTPEEFIDAGDHVVVRVRQEARGEQGGTPVTASFWFVYTLNAGKIVRLGMFPAKEEALEAVGLAEWAMSQENVEIVRGVYTDPHGLSAGASGKIAPDAVFDFSAAYLDGPILSGVKALRGFRDSGPWGGSPIHFEPERFFDLDDERVLVFVRVSATGHGSRVPVELAGAHEFTIRDEMVVRFKAYRSHDQALAAAGLAE